MFIGCGSYKRRFTMSKKKPNEAIEEVKVEIEVKVTEVTEDAVEKTKPNEPLNYRYGDAEHDDTTHATLKPKGVPHNKRWPYPGD